MRVVQHSEARPIAAPAGLWLLGETGYLHLQCRIRTWATDRGHIKELFPEALVTGPNEPWPLFQRSDKRLVIADEEEEVLLGKVGGEQTK